MSFNRQNTPHKTIWMLELLTRGGMFYWTFTNKELAIDWAIDWIKDNKFNVDIQANVEEHGKEAVMWDWGESTDGKESFFLDELELYGE